MYKKEKVLDVMMYFGELKGMTRADAKQFSLEYLERVKLADKANVRLDKLSGGQQQRAAGEDRVHRDAFRVGVGLTGHGPER